MHRLLVRLDFSRLDVDNCKDALLLLIRTHHAGACISLRKPPLIPSIGAPIFVRLGGLLGLEALKEQKHHSNCGKQESSR
ncbi:hypothetical protein EBH_0056030 [Eimeria brunetti]|uniref:Uncharacterized protein n=1 Tax=Eimeria brunetti TaxID=51314 RepID=U6M0C1_9EIME|nr:hypothetical protein EBH_0056030 [Eimeria brunetti]